MHPDPPANLTPPNKDDEHIKLLVIFHYITAGLTLLGILFLFLHYYMLFSVMMNDAMWQNSNEPPPPKEFFLVFRWFYVFMGALMIAGGVLNILSANFMRKRANRMFSIVVSGMNCLSMPLGTALGIFTIIVLMRSTVQSSYNAEY